MWKETTTADMTTLQCLMVGKSMMPKELGSTVETAHQRKYLPSAGNLTATACHCANSSVQGL